MRNLLCASDAYCLEPTRSGARSSVAMTLLACAVGSTSEYILLIVDAGALLADLAVDGQQGGLARSGSCADVDGAFVDESVTPDLVPELTGESEESHVGEWCVF